MVDSTEASLAEVEVEAVDIIPFYEVTWECADAEGEGFHSIQH